MRIRITHKFILLISFIAAFQYVRAQGISNEGTEFYAVFPSHVNAPDYVNNVLVRNNFAEYSIFITGKQPSSGVVSVNGTIIPFNLLQGNSVVEVKVPRAAAYIDHNDQKTVLTNRAIRIIVDPGKPKVVVYGHIFAGRRSAASLILPREALGQQYFSMNYQIGPAAGGSLSQNHIVVAAVDPNTRIFFQDRNGTDLVPGGVFLPNAGDVYEFLSPNDLTGTKVFVDPLTSACNKFALFSGTTNSSVVLPTSCVDAGNGFASSDPLYQQNYPVESWGKSYGFIPFSSISAGGSNVRTNGNYVRVVAKEDNTKVVYNGTEVATLNAGQMYTTPGPVTEPAYITANNPIAAAQYALSVTCAGGVGQNSDADMVIMNPIEYNIKNITLYSSPKEAITEQYINVLIKTIAVSSFKVNGVTPAQKFTPLKGAPGYSYLQLNLNSYNTNSFNLSASEGFNAIAYGFGYAESYAYSAGTNLASSQSVIAVKTDTKEEIIAACSNQDFNVKVTLTSPALSLSWQFAEGGSFEEQTITTPVAGVVRNGTTYYDYYFPRPVSYPTAGVKIIKVIAKYPSMGGCALGEQQIDLSLEVYDPPVPRFKTSTNFCALTEIQFTDQSEDKGDPITKWRWDFGDNGTSEEQNPVHVFAAPGNYVVKLLVENSIGCQAVAFEQTLTIGTVPKAAFAFTKPGCTEYEVTFTDMSTIDAGNIVKWSWSFGDGSPKVDNTSNSGIRHEYVKGGDYLVSLTVTSATGCENSITQTVTVPAPSLDIGEDLTILQGGSFTFNISATGTNLRYKWSPSAGLDRDDIRNPTATPTQDTPYTLTITTEEGCVITDDIFIKVVEKPIIRNTFTPNGDGVNDLWLIDYLESYPEVRVDIFNRFGVKVYASIGYTTPWDGNSNGSQLPVGTYYYVIDPKMGLPAYTGWVTILR
ncbi:PKD domain-containing protein [Daejeonella sp. JGW-45]|uniref:PKD domain-containing protein n=1 Tax=Daejeonella sp. JGW-45 TaxID=3034148 RepID=UPI0023EB956A|nr:PKD domain-containing protein [Daejeonella sp. JGW-45]